MPMTSVDVMAFGAHPDDIELGCGGTLIKLVDAGFSVVMVDMVRGELGTRGTPEMRAKEAARAAATIGAVARENLALEDGNIQSNAESKRRVATVIRKYRPQMVLLPYYRDRHPDHYHTSQAVYEGTFVAGLTRYDTGQPSYRPARVAYYMGWYEFEPTFVIDITEQFDRKMQAIYAYSTQFQADDPSYEQTVLTSPEYHLMLRQRMGHYGSLIRVQYGEGFLIRGQLQFDHPLDADFFSY
jgi:bacillithiol biosynthesis deacetylase BshB1